MIRCGIRAYSTHSKRQIEDVFIISQARTPLGTFQGQLKALSATKLGSHAISNAILRAGIDNTAIEEVYMGCVLQAGLGQAPARQAALGAGLPNSVPCSTVNKVCASGLKAMTMAASQLAIGHRNVMVAGGMESLSNTPYTLPRGATPYGGLHLLDSCNHDGLTDAYTLWHMGRCAENTAEKLGFSKSEQDDYGELSYRRTEKAIADGIFEGEISSLLVTDKKKSVNMSHDEEVQGHNFKYQRSIPCKWGNTVGVSSSSKLADGAAAAVMANETGIKQHNLTPLARVVAYSDVAMDPVDWPVAPALGINNLLARAGLRNSDISKWEINEAFSVVILANARELDIDVQDVNVHGGAISIGHPFGMSGARITNHLAHILRSGEYGVASLCNGGGGAGSILIQKI